MRGANAGPPVLGCASRVGLALGLCWGMLVRPPGWVCQHPVGQHPGIAREGYAGPGCGDGFGLLLWEISGYVALFRRCFPALVLDHVPKWL